MGTFEPRLGDRPQLARLELAHVDWQRGLLVRSTNYVRDAVQSLPALWRLRNLLPADAPLRVLCRERLRGFWRCVPWVDQVIGFAGRRCDPRVLRAALPELPGASVVLPNSFGSLWDLWRAGMPERIGRKANKRTALLHHGLPAWRSPGPVHHARRYLELAWACGSEDWGLDFPPLALPPDAAPDRLPGGELLVVAPGGGAPARQWPARHFREVARFWNARFGPVLALAGSGEEDWAQAVIAGCQQAGALAGPVPLETVVQALAGARLVVSNDNGTMQLAAAMGIPGVAVFGGSDPIATGPLATNWCVLTKKLACAPCRRRTCWGKDLPYECLRTLRSPEVLAAVQELMAGTGAPA